MLKKLLKSLDVGKLLTPRKASRLSNIVVVIVLLIVAYFVFSMGKKYLYQEGFSNLKSGEKGLVLLHMNGCGHCKTLMPKWNEAKNENDSNVQMFEYEMNDPKGKELCSKHDVSGFPTIIVVDNKGNKLGDYDGERTKEGILSFLKSM